MNGKRVWTAISLVLLLGTCAWAGGGFDDATFRQFIDVRVGDGEHPVYWYSVGELYSYPDGTLIALVEGVDTARLAPGETDSVFFQYSRKTFIYRDPATQEILREVGGVPVRPIAYPYQYITYRHEGDELVTLVEQGSGKRLRTVGPGRDMVARKVGEVTIYSAPLFLDVPAGPRRYQAYENYDFFVHPGESPDRLQLSWVRYGDLPRWAGEGKGMMHLLSRRMDRFEDLPATLREYILEEAPLWKAPPADLEEIRKLQKGDPAPAPPARAAQGSEPS